MDRVAALYRDHIHFVWRVLWRFRMPAADVEDLAQEVFIVVLRLVRAENPPLMSEDHQRAWLYRITTYELKNYRSRARFRRTEPMDEHTTNFPHPRNDYAALADRETLLLLLDSIKGKGGREIFELVELEGWTVVQAAETLGITEPNAYRRLGRARKDVDAAVAKLRREEAREKKTSAFLMPLGVGGWLSLRELQNPPESTIEEIWKRLQATAAELDRENERPATPPPAKLPARPQALAGHLKGALGHVVSACVGGAIVALVFLLPPSGKGEHMPIPVPVFVVTSATTAPAPLPAPNSLDAPPTTDTDAAPATDTDAAPPTDATLDEETQLIRQARASIASNNRKGTIEALDAYLRRFPGGRFANKARALRTSGQAAATK